MGTDLSQLSMLELFRMEAASLCGGMCSALIDLESQGDVAPLAELMRAAHSLKGAARIVGVDALVALGHAMEDRLSAAQRAEAAPARAHIDALLAATDIFAQVVHIQDDALPAWLDGLQPRIQALVSGLAENDPVAAGPAAAAADTTWRPAGQPAPPAGSAAPAVQVAPAMQAAAAVHPAPAAQASPALHPAPGRELRLEAAQMASLLGLAREAVLVNRAQQRQSEQLMQLHRAQRRVDHALDRLREGLQQQRPPEQLAALLEGAASASRRSAALLGQHAQDHAAQAQRAHRVSTRLHHSVNSTRMVRFAGAEPALKRLVRDTGQRLGKPVALVVHGGQTQVDRDVLDRIEAPLAHLLRNAIDHGIEPAAERAAAGKPATATVTVTSRHHRGQLEVGVSDDGGGVNLAALRRRVAAKGLSTAAMLEAMGDAELLDFLFLPGFTTRDAVSETSGRGVGLDVVQTCVQALGGRLRVDNRPGRGLAITLVLPVSLSMMHVLLVRVCGETYALPLAQLERVQRVPASGLQWLAGQACARVGGRDIACAPLAPLLGLPAPAMGQDLVLVEIAAHAGGSRFGLVVDQLVGECELALQALDARLPKQVHVAAAAMLDDGRPVLLLDVDDLATSLAQGGGATGTMAAPAAENATAPPRVLVVEDSFTVREVERKVLAAGGYQVDVAVDGVEGWNALSAQHYDLVVTDIDMPRMNGLELLRRLRASERTRHLPVMIVSYKDREADRLAGMEAGADRYFVKSGFEESALLQAVADLIGTADAHRDRQ